METDKGRAALRFVGWLVAFLVALAASGWLLFGENDALAKAESIDEGTATTVSAKLDVILDKNERRRIGKPDRNGADEWTARCTPDDPEVDLGGGSSLDVPGNGKVLDEWDGATVTCYLWNDDVIAVELPDGTVLRDQSVGWRGAIARGCSGLFAFGAALLIGGTRLRMGFWTAFAGGSLMALVGLVGLHLAQLWIGLAADAVLVLVVVWFVFSRSSGDDEDTDKDTEEPALADDEELDG